MASPFTQAGQYHEVLLERVGNSRSVLIASGVDVHVLDPDTDDPVTLYTDVDKTDTVEQPIHPTDNGNLKFHADPGPVHVIAYRGGHVVKDFTTIISVGNADVILAADHADAAETSASEADASATAAGQSASEASDSATAASGHASSAEGFRDQASGHADDAASSATAAEQSASEAESFRDEAQSAALIDGGAPDTNFDPQVALDGGAPDSF